MLSPTHVMFIPETKYGSMGDKMTIGQIIVFGMVCFAFWLGNRSGYANGYVAGRKAVRKHYEELTSRLVNR